LFDFLKLNVSSNLVPFFIFFFLEKILFYFLFLKSFVV